MISSPERRVGRGTAQPARPREAVHERGTRGNALRTGLASLPDRPWTPSSPPSDWFLETDTARPLASQNQGRSRNPNHASKRNNSS